MCKSLFQVTTKQTTSPALMQLASLLGEGNELNRYDLLGGMCCGEKYTKKGDYKMLRYQPKDKRVKTSKKKREKQLRKKPGNVPGTS